MRFLHLLVALGLTAALARAAAADLTYTEKTSDKTTNLLDGRQTTDAAESRVSIKGDKVKFVTKDRVFIFRPDLKKWWDIYPEQKCYYETTFDGFVARGEQQAAKLPDLKQQVSTLPEFRQKAFAIWEYRLREHLGKVTPPQDPTEVQTPPEESEVGGAKCTRTVVVWAGQNLFDAWIDPSLDGFAALVGMYEANRAFSPYVLARLKALKGFPRKGTQTVLWLTGHLSVVTFEYTDFKSEPVADAEFELPAGLTKK
ncbi:MAG: hypothetical protein HZA54_15695 [Planctomycetes bacterium]|nr:hypothetical protein [Planctomycetota bacterium]